MSDPTQAVIFDFDGILFRKGCRWKVTNPRVGISGSLVGHEEGLKLLDKVFQFHPDAKVNDYFIIEDYIPDAFPVNGTVDILPIEDIVQTADTHRFRGRDIYILSSKKFEKFYFIVDRIFHRYKNFPSQTNPFQAEENLICLNEEEGVNDTEKKMNFLKNILKCREEDYPVRTHIQINGRSILRYEKIFYYHTQSDLVPEISQFIQSGKDRFIDGKNALVSSYITTRKAISER